MPVTKEDYMAQIEIYKNARGHYAEEALVKLFEMLSEVAFSEEKSVS